MTAPLTPQERRLLSLRAAGASDRRVCRELALELDDVHALALEVRRKLGLSAFETLRDAGRRLKRLERDLARATKDAAKASEARAALPPGSSRGRVTSANARWMRKAEHRDRLARELERFGGAT